MTNILHPITIPLILLISSVLILSLVIISPQLSPVPSIADSDGDGYTNEIDEFPDDPLEWNDSDGDGFGDNSDAFPSNASEHSDLDGDGIGDNIDIIKQGNAGVNISIRNFQFLGYDNNYHRWKNIPDVWFNILIDMNNDSVYDLTYESDIFYSSSSLSNVFSIQFDIADYQKTIRFSIIIYDVWETNGSRVTDSEIMDYSPVDGMKIYSHSLVLPFSESWNFSGIGDDDTPDCSVSYQFDTIIID